MQIYLLLDHCSRRFSCSDLEFFFRCLFPVYWISKMKFFQFIACVCTHTYQVFSLCTLRVAHITCLSSWIVCIDDKVVYWNAMKTKRARNKVMKTRWNSLHNLFCCCVERTDEWLKENVKTTVNSVRWRSPVSLKLYWTFQMFVLGSNKLSVQRILHKKSSLPRVHWS